MIIMAYDFDALFIQQIGGIFILSPYLVDHLYRVRIVAVQGHNHGLIGEYPIRSYHQL